jgi:hypothetical protein
MNKKSSKINKHSSKRNKQSSKMNKQSSKVNVRQYNGGKQSSKMNKQSSKGNVRQYNGVHFTALFTPLYCLTFILLLCLPHCIVWLSFYCSVFPIVLSDIHFTPLFTSLQWGKQSSKMNVRQYNEVNRAVKWMSDKTMG